MRGTLCHDIFCPVPFPASPSDLHRLSPSSSAWVCCYEQLIAPQQSFHQPHLRAGVPMAKGCCRSSSFETWKGPKGIPTKGIGKTDSMSRGRGKFRVFSRCFRSVFRVCFPTFCGYPLWTLPRIKCMILGSWGFQEVGKTTINLKHI